MYDRTVKPIPPSPRQPGLRYHIRTLVGLTGLEMTKYRSSWREAMLGSISLVWRPHLLAVLLFEAMLFGFGIGINVTNAVFLGTPPPVGFGFSQTVVAGMYATPLVSRRCIDAPCIVAEVDGMI
jgi:hypothetical protein